MDFLKKIIKIILLIGIILLVCSYFKKDNLPPKEEILPELYQEPSQTRTQSSSFKIEKGGIIYEVSPLFNYELYGLVVSEHSSKSWFDYYHEKWEDFINLKDVCIVWGSNIESGVYEDLKFNNGSFTCYINYKHGVEKDETYQKFKNNALSNNHLLSEDDSINKKIMEAQDGDQIHLKGYLAKYSHDGFTRGTSINRDDSGNGACETIYLTDFEIIKKANVFWRNVYSFFKYLIIVLVVILVILFFSDLYLPKKNPDHEARVMRG